MNFEFGRTFCFFRQLGGQVRSHLDKGSGGGGVTDAPDLWTVLHSTLSTAVIAVPTELYEFFQGNAVCPQMAIASVGIDRWGPPAQRGSLLRNDVTQFICLRHQVLERSASSSYVFFFKKKLLGNVCKCASISGRLMAPMMAAIQFAAAA